MTYKIKYKNRYPVQQKNADGKKICRGCGGDIPKGRRSWCSKECFKKYDPQSVIIAVNKRDNKICCECEYNYKKEFKKWSSLSFELIKLNWLEYEKSKPKPIEYHHVIPMYRGGLTILENMITLCNNCHKKKHKSGRTK